MSDKNHKSDQPQINTSGGAYVGGNVDTTGAPFIGRDQVTKATGGSVIVTGGKVGVINTGDGNVITQQQGVSLEEFANLLAEMRKLLPHAGLAPDVVEVIDADFRVVEEQAAKEKPTGAIILSKLEGAAKMLTAMSGAAVAAQKLAPLAQKAVEWAGQLFG